MNNHATHLKLVLAAVLGLAVLGAFGVPVVSYLPLIAILAICPIMMIFMMKGMNHGGSSQDDNADLTSTGHRH